jgi:hypothetical protein
MTVLSVEAPTGCPSQIRCQTVTGSWTKSRQWETHRTWFSVDHKAMRGVTSDRGAELLNSMQTVYRVDSSWV